MDSSTLKSILQALAAAQETELTKSARKEVSGAIEKYELKDLSKTQDSGAEAGGKELQELQETIIKGALDKEEIEEKPEASPKENTSILKHSNETKNIIDRLRRLRRERKEKYGQKNPKEKK